MDVDVNGISPVIATILLIALTVAAVGIVAVMLSTIGTPSTVPTASLTLKGHYYPRYDDLDRACVKINHSGGDTIAPADIYVLFRAKYNGRNDDYGTAIDVKGKIDGMGTAGPTITWTSQWSGTTNHGGVSTGTGAEMGLVCIPYNPDPLAPGTYWELVFETTDGSGGGGADTVFDILEISIVHKASGNVLFQNLSVPAPTVLGGGGGGGVSPMTFYSTNSDGWIQYTDQNGDYTVAHEAEFGDVWDMYDGVVIGQRQVWEPTPDWYSIYRGFLFFDTSFLTQDVTVISAKLEVQCVSIGPTGDQGAAYEIVVQNGQPTYPHDPLEESDYYYGYYSGNGGSVSSWTKKNAYGNPNNTGWHTFTLNEDGISWINKGGVTKFCLRAVEDINAVFSRNVQIQIASYESGADKPKLVVTYTT